VSRAAPSTTSTSRASIPFSSAVRANELQEGATGSVPAACRNLTADGVTSLHTDPGPGYAKRYRTLLEAQEALGATSKTEGILAACQHADADRRIIVPQSELNSHLLQGVYM